MRITVMEIAVAAEGMDRIPKVGDEVEAVLIREVKPALGVVGHTRSYDVKGEVVRVYTFNEYQPGAAQ